MKQSDLKNAFRPATQGFHNAVNSALKSTAQVSVKTHNHSLVKIALACIIVLAFATTSVYAVTEIYSIIVKPKGQYGLNFNLDSSTTHTSPTAAPANSWAYVKLHVGWLPPDISEQVNSYGNKYTSSSNNQNRFFSFSLTKTEDGFNFLDKNITDYTEYDVNGNKGYIAKRLFSENEETAAEYNQSKFYIYFEKEKFFLDCYVGSEIKGEELEKVMESVSIREGTADDYSFQFVDYVDADNYSPDANFSYQHNFNQQFNYNSYISPQNCTDSNAVSICVNSISVYDNINQFDKGCFNTSLYELSSYVDGNGSILPYTRKIYAEGDGVSSIDRLIKSEEVDRRFVVVSVNIKNTAPQEESYYFNDILRRLKKASANKLSMFEYGHGMYCINTLDSDIPYIDNNDVGKYDDTDGFLRKTLAGNSEETVNLGFFVDEDSINDLYFTIKTSEVYETNATIFNYKYIKVTP